MSSSATPFASGTTVLLLGTRRGLFIVSSRDREHWECFPTALGGNKVFYATLDQRGGNRLFAAENGDFFGDYIKYSDDFGQTWNEPERGIKFSEESGLALKNLWTIESGRESEPQTMYVGVDPASLWVSHDYGVTWDMNTGLESHPTRPTWEPGNGGLCLHTIIPDYSNPKRMWVAISAVGVLRTEDGGETWTFANQGTRAGFLPEPYVEYGQCVHRVVQHPTQPDTLYQQNHCGVYKTTNGGVSWDDIQRDLPSEFGFPIALDYNNPDTVYTVIEDPMARHNLNQQFTVFRTRDAGDTWTPQTNGLPGGANVRLGVLRHGMCSDRNDPSGVYVGTNTGQLFASVDGGDSWRMIAEYLPAIYSVTAAVIR